MKLTTAAVLKKFEKSRTCGQEILVKYFDPCGRYTLYVTEAEKCGDDWRLYGYCVSPLGPDCDEYGYIMLSELQSVRNRFGLGIERDLHFSGTLPQVLKEVA